MDVADNTATAGIYGERLPEVGKHAFKLPPAVVDIHRRRHPPSSDLKVPIIALSETWLRYQPQLLQYVSVPGFTTEFRNRQGLKGGGVGAYIKDNIKYKRRRDIENSCPEMEHLVRDSRPKQVQQSVGGGDL